MPTTSIGHAILMATSAMRDRTGGPLRRLVRLLRCYRLAVDAESNRLVRRADFYWREGLRQLEAAWSDAGWWDEVLQQPRIQDIARDGRADPDSLRDAVARELFADSLWALRGALQGTDDRGIQRGQDLLDYLRQLVDRTAPLDDARMAALGAAVREAVSRAAQDQRWETAQTFASWLVERFGAEEDQTLLAAMIRAQAVAALTDSQDESASKHEATALADPIRRIAALHDRFPRNAAFGDVLGELHVRMAVKLANGGRVSDALVAAQKAITYDPGAQTAREVRDKIADLMRQVQQNADSIRQQLASTPTAALTGKGQEVFREADRGFAAFNAFLESAAAREISERFRRAQGASAWTSIGLPPQPSDEQLDQLYDVLNRTFLLAEGDPARAAGAWQQATSEVPGGAALDGARIQAWVQRRLAGSSSEPAPAAVVQWPAAVSTAPIRQASRSLDHEPFTSWLLSAEALWPKAACAAALIALCIALVMFTRDSRNRRERDAAFEGLRAARAAGEYTRVLDAAEAFLSVRLSAVDAREIEVKAAYSEALVRWFTEGIPGADADRRAARYRTLVLERTAGGSR